MALGLEKRRRSPELYEKARAKRTHVSKHEGICRPFRPTLWSLLLVLWDLVSHTQCSGLWVGPAQRWSRSPLEAMERISKAALSFLRLRLILVSCGSRLLHCQYERGPASVHFLKEVLAVFTGCHVSVALGHSNQKVPCTGVVSSGSNHLHPLRLMLAFLFYEELSLSTCVPLSILTLKDVHWGRIRKQGPWLRMCDM